MQTIEMANHLQNKHPELPNNRYHQASISNKFQDIVKPFSIGFVSRRYVSTIFAGLINSVKVRLSVNQISGSKTFGKGNWIL